jgi:PKD repeat protein
MNTLKQISLVVLFACCTLIGNAQLLTCGANANWGYTINPNNVHVFTDSSTVTPGTNWQITNHYWTFGDTINNTSNQTNPTHYFSHPGMFTVCEYVIATSNGGTTTCIDTFCQTVNNCAGMVVATYNYTTQNNGVVIYNGAGSSNYPPLSYAWTFAGAIPSTSNTATTTVQYANSGTYPTCLTVTDANGCQASYCQNLPITTSICGNAVADFTVSPQAGTVTLASTSTGTANYTLYQWYMDGQALTNPNPNTAYTLTGVSAGNHTFCLYLYGNANTFCDSVCHTITIPSSGCNLSAAFQTSAQGNTATFHANSNPSGTNSYWVFGDGVTVSDTNATVVHTYPTNPNSITYYACHYVYTPGTNCVDSACHYVVIPGSNSCNATAQITPSTNVNGSITLTPTFTGGVAATFLWSSGQITASITITAPGTYCVTITGTNNCSASACYTYTNPCLNLSAAWTQTYVANGGVQFTGTNNANTITEYWTFGDGNISTLHNPLHHYTTAGLYTVCHYVQLQGSICADTSCQSIQANAGQPCASFAVNINSITNPNGGAGLEAVTAGGSTPISYVWSNTATTGAIFPTASGVYCVTVFDNNQCSAVACDTFNTNTNPCNALYTYTLVNCNTVHFTNVSTGAYTNLVWYFGDGTSSSSVNPTHTFPVGTWTVQLTVYSNSGCQATYYSVITVQPCGSNNDTICGTIFNDTNGNGVQDNNETGLGGGTVYAGNYTATVNSNGHYQLIVPAGTYTVYYCATGNNSFTIPVGSNNPNTLTGSCASYTVTTNGSNNCGYNFGVQNNTTTICGTVYFDANNNQTQDANTESGIANAVVTITGSNGNAYTTYTDQNGNYCVTVPAGTYTITVLTTFAGATITPQVITVTVINGVNSYHNDFAVYAQPGACDLSISITPHTTVTAGFAAWYSIEICNVGASVSNGTANLFFDNALVFNSSSPAQTSANNSTHTVTWAVNNLLPGSCAYYWVDFDALTSTQIGQHIFMLANVTTTNCNEANFTNNVDTVHQDATASWDPNNKLVLPIGVGAEGAIMGNEELTYTINFQNTGTSPAVNVVLRDMFDTDLNLETFRMIGASHPYTMQFNGREAIWKFSSIMLPDSNTNEEASHGHVTFTIKPNIGLAQGTQLTNMANIYFDYNEAVATNTALNSIDYALSLSDIENGIATITLMPNPFKEFTTIKIDGDNATYELKVYDMLGQLIRKDITGNNTFTIQRETLASGVYMYEVTKANKVIGKGKMVAE